MSYIWVSYESFWKALSNETKLVFVTQFVQAQLRIELTWLGTIIVVQMLLTLSSAFALFSLLTQFYISLGGRVRPFVRLPIFGLTLFSFFPWFPPFSSFFIFYISAISNMWEHIPPNEQKTDEIVKSVKMEQRQRREVSIARLRLAKEPQRFCRAHREWRKNKEREEEEEEGRKRRGGSGKRDERKDA